MNAPERKAGIAPFAVHGGRLAEARAHFPHATLPWIDLSTGIAPWPYPIPQLPVECWARLPEPEALAGLIAAAWAYYRAPEAAHIVAVAGTDLAIGLIARLDGGKRRVGVVSPTYGSHASAWRTAGHDVHEVRGLDQIAAAEIGVVVNPNNPDGQTWRPEGLRDLARTLAAKGGYLIVDEAFGDVNPDVSVLDGASELPGMIVLRSFGKFFGLAGVRLGFVIGGHPVVRAVEQTVGAWPVSGAAVQIGTRALGDSAWVRAQRVRLALAAGTLERALKSAGLTVAGGTDLFRLVEGDDGARLFEHLAGRGILVRPFEGGRHLRFGLPGNEREMDRLAAALIAFKSGEAAP